MEWTRELPVPQSVAAGRAQSVPPLKAGLSVQVLDGGAPFVGTVSIEVSLDGSHWLPSKNANLTGMTGGDIPKASLEVIEESVRWIRANATAYTSGVARILLNGIPEQ